MPSITSISDYSLTNIGPLTTTWTAPASCATKTNEVWLAFTDAPAAAIYAPDCDLNPVGDCAPSGPQLDALWNATENIIFGGPLPYYSPGLFCPDTWTTAGIAVKDGNGKLVSSSGLFAPTRYNSITIGPDPTITYVETETPRQTSAEVVTNVVGPGSTVTSTYTPTIAVETFTTTFAPESNPPWNIFMEAMAPSETAVVCCPSAYSVDFWGNCYSNVPRASYTATTACQRDIDPEVYTSTNATFSYYGRLVTATEYVQTKTDGLVIKSSTMPLPTSRLTEMTGVVYAAMPTLVRKEGDTSNAAPGARIGGGAGSVLGLLTIWTIATLAGAVLLAPF